MTGTEGPEAARPRCGGQQAQAQAPTGSRKGNGIYLGPLPTGGSLDTSIEFGVNNKHLHHQHQVTSSSTDTRGEQGGRREHRSPSG